MKNDTTQYLSGSIVQTMMRTAIGMLPGTIAISGYNIADTYFVSQLGTDQLAAMGFTFPAVMLIGCLFRGLGTGVMATASHALGGRKHDRAAKLVTSGLLLTAFVAVILSLIGIFTSRSLFELCGASGIVLEHVCDYMIVWYAGSVTSALQMTGNDVVIAAGGSRIASTFMVVGLVANVILDPLFIFGYGPFPHLGITGAAYATVLSQFLGMLGIMYYLHFRYHLLAAKTLVWERLRRYWPAVLRFAIPSILGMMLMPIGNGVITRIVAEYGNDAVAACAAAGRLEVLAFVFPMSLGISLMPMVGQNYGAKQYQRIRDCRRIAFRIAIGFELLMAVLYFIFAPQLVVHFSTDARVCEIMILYLRIISIGFGMVEVHRYSGFFFTGCDRPNTAALLNAMRILVFLIPLSLLALVTGSLAMLFIARLAADIFSGAIGYYLTFRLTRELLARSSGTAKAPSLVSSASTAGR